MKPQKELDLSNVVNMCLDEHVDFFTVRLFQRAEEPNVERLGNVGGMRRETDRENVVLFAVGLKIHRLVTLVPVKHQHPITTLCARLLMLIEVFDLVQVCLILCPPI